ncbi:MAG: hypothetical protein AAB546_00025 [Patescibacteria group bacterium]
MPEHYWTLVIETGWVEASIWTTEDSPEGKKAKVIATSTSIAWETNEELIISADSALSDCISSYPENLPEPSKVVFGVPSSWVSEGNIQDIYLEKIRILCSKLSLEPSGFVVLSEAIAYFVKAEEGSPLTGVVVGLGREYLDVSLFKLGNLVGNVSVARSVSLTEDIVEGLSRFPVEDHYPSRFIIYNGKSGELELARDTLTQADWMRYEKLKFLHTPKIETMDPQKKVVAVSLAGASEIAGASVVESNIVETPSADLPSTSMLTEDVQNLETQTVDPRTLGFSLGQDVTQEFTNNTQSSFAHHQPQSHVPHPNALASAPLMAKSFLAKVTTNFSKFKMPAIKSTGVHLPKPHFKQTDLMENSLPFKIGTGAILAIFVGLFVGWWFLVKAQVTLYIAPKELSKKQTIFVNTSGKSNSGSNTIAGKIVSKQVSGDTSGVTTGTKTVGEKAKGKVQIRNGTSVAVKLTTSTVVVSSGDLKFNPTQSASISAATSPTSPGTAIVDVIAADIGSEYNLAKDESFKVGNYPKSEVDAVADTAMSGGSSREIQAVSASDQSNLEEKLIATLTDQGKESLTSSLADNELVIDDATEVTASEKDFNKKVGDEAQELKLTMTAEVSAPVISKDELNKLARAVLDPDVPEGFILRDDQIKNEFTVIDDKGGVLEVELNTTANLLPSLNPDEIAKKIKGKSSRDAQEYLSTIPGFSRAAIKLKPQLTGRLGSLPRIAKNISIEIAADR